MLIIATTEVTLPVFAVSIAILSALMLLLGVLVPNVGIQVTRAFYFGDQG
jgi:hypothetical protein